MSLFRLDTSLFPHQSRSRALADIVEAEWRVGHPDAAVVRRDLVVDPVPAQTWAASVSSGFVPQDQWTAEQRAARTLAAEAVDQLVAADDLLFAVPLYNFGVSQHFKSWVDLVISDPRMAAGVEPVTAGKRAVLVTVRGGNYSAGTPRAGWDHATGWMQRILADVWRLDLTTVENQFTLVGVNPALDQFTEVAAAMRSEAEGAAADAGRSLAGALTR